MLVEAESGCFIKSSHHFISCYSFQQNFPRTLEALILHMLSPVGAEVLTRKFDEMDQQTSEEDRNKFYEIFYGAFDDQFAAMDAILNGKESFALQGVGAACPFIHFQEYALIGKI
ncbi:hypothetical protein Patl1_03294 [Pistacia atlantica]|uniref:Uncharacterized protein n=1 Tax=Pistacia atlantica TaxID=434234 RepID=A0ACC1CCM1_9ROSI|nr:hypothetical protein Patl1_03294 [Pistacia atlantica]